MAPVLEFLRILRFARNCIKRVPTRGRPSLASLLALLGRKLTTWWRFWFGHPKSAERPPLGSQASSYSVSGDSAVVREYVIAASYVPASASNPSLHERTDEQPGTVTQIAAQTAGIRWHLPVLENLPVNDLRDQSPLHPLDGGSFANRSSGNLSTISIESLASDRFSIITNSRISLRAARGQPSRLPRASRRSSVNSTGNLSNISSRSRASDRYSILTNPRESISSPLGPPSPSRLPRATHRQFGSGPGSSRSRERPSRPHTPTSPPLEIMTNLTSLHGDGKVKPVVQSAASSSSIHQPLSPPSESVNRIRRRQSTTSVVVNVQNPSSESLSVSPSSYSPKYSPQITEEPLAIDSDDYLSPGSPAVDLRDESYPGLPTSFNPGTLDYSLPNGRFVQLINSDQIPRYTKDATMRVGYTILLFDAYISF